MYYYLLNLFNLNRCVMTEDAEYIDYLDYAQNFPYY